MTAPVFCIARSDPVRLEPQGPRASIGLPSRRIEYHGLSSIPLRSVITASLLTCLLPCLSKMALRSRSSSTPSTLVALSVFEADAVDRLSKG
jgi:hypothetical protein